MPLIFIHHHKNEVTAFNTECTIGSLNTALVDLANNGDSNGASKTNLSSYFSAPVLRSKASDRSSQALPEDFAKEKTGSLIPSPHLYKKVELVPLSFVMEIASNQKLLAALCKRTSSSYGSMSHAATSPQSMAFMSLTDGNTPSVSVSSSITSVLSSYVSNIPFVGLRTTPEQSTYFSLPGLNGSAPNSTNASDGGSATCPALILLGCRMDSLKESGFSNHLGGSIMVPPLDDKRGPPQPDFDERKLGIKSSIHDNHPYRSIQQLNHQLQNPFASGHTHDSISFSATLDPRVGVSRYDGALEMNSGITDRVLDHVAFTGMLNLIKNIHIAPYKGSKGVRDDSQVLITHPIPPALNEGDSDAMEKDVVEGLEKQRASSNEDTTATQSKSFSHEEGATSGKNNRNPSLSQSSGKEANKKKNELAASAAAAAGIGASINGNPPIPLSRAAQDLLLCPQRPTSSMALPSMTNSGRPTSPMYAAPGSSAEKSTSLALWLKGVESLDVLWSSPNGEHEVLSRLLQEFVRIEKQKIAADEALRVAALPTRGPSVLTLGAATDPPKSKK